MSMEERLQAIYKALVGLKLDEVQGILEVTKNQLEYAHSRIGLHVRLLCDGDWGYEKEKGDS